MALWDNLLQPALVVMVVAGAAFFIKEVVMGWLDREEEQAKRDREQDR